MLVDRCGRPYPITDGVEGRPGSLLDGGCGESGSIDPRALNLSLLIKPTILQCISSIQGVFVGLLVPWTQEVAYGMCGRTYWCGRA
jgi:hypothetical protein